MEVTMTAKSRKAKPSSPAESTAPLTSSDETVETLAPSQLTKRRIPVESMHLNLRLTGEAAEIYRYLEKQTPSITDSLRIRDCVRIAAFLCAKKQQNEAVTVAIDGKAEDLLEYIGAFYPQTPMDTRRRAAR